MKRLIARGAAWMLLFRVAEKSLGLISTIVLARVLVPADFGLVAMAMSIIALVELAGAFSFETVLIQKEQPTRIHYDTAWTLNVLFGVSCAAIMMALAVPAAGFYSEPRLVVVVCVIAAGWALQGLENVGVIDFRRQMDFRKEFMFLALKRISAFVVTVVLAIVLRNYWALVAGMMVGRLAGAVSSYGMSSYRPRLTLAAHRELFRFSSWLLVANIVNFAETRFAHFFVGRVQGPDGLGLYTIGNDLASIPTTELSAPINRAAFPGYSRLATRPTELAAEANTVIGMIGLVTLPLALGVTALAEPLIALVMGNKWLPIVPILQVLVLSGAMRSIMSNYHTVYLALGHAHLSPILDGGRVLIMITLTVVLAPMSGLIGVAQAQAISMALGFIASSIMFVKVLGIRWVTPITLIARPLLASLAMLGVIHGALSWVVQLGLQSPGARLAFGVAVGTLSYLIALAAIWLLWGRPVGPEMTLTRTAIQWLGSAETGSAR